MADVIRYIDADEQYPGKAFRVVGFNPQGEMLVEPLSVRPTQRIIELLRSVNGTAIDNDGKPGQFVQDLCQDAADRLQLLDHSVMMLKMRKQP